MAIMRTWHQQMLITVTVVIDFYKKLGFVREGKREPMWIYAGNDHDPTYTDVKNIDDLPYN
jgi:ribosomal protein S18 acetylase RimI-like enzyme